MALDISSLLAGIGGPGTAGAPGESIIQRLLREQSQQGFFGTPGFNPNAQSPEDFLRQAQMGGIGNFGGASPQSNIPQSEISAAVPQNQPLPQRGIDKILQAFGKPGQSVSKFISPVTNVLGAVGDVAEEAALKGRLGAIAPQFSAGVQGAADREMQAALLRAQTDLARSKASAPAGDPQTQTAKIIDDARNNRISTSQADALLQEELDSGRQTRFDMEKSLRGEFRNDVSGPRESLSGLAAAEALLSNNNAISDTAAFTSFIRAIDNSVVRPAEQEAYNKALGLRNQIEATVQQWAGKGPLPPATKKQLLDSVRKLRDTMEGITDRTVDFYNKRASKFELDPEGVTGIPVKFEQQEVVIGEKESDSKNIPEGITRDEWEVMTPEEKALF